MGGDSTGVDVGVDSELFVRAQGHDHLFKRRVAGAFADSVDGDFRLARASHDAGDGVGRGHAQVVVAVGGYDYVVDAVDVLHEILYFLAEFPWQAVAGGVGDVDDRGPGLHYGLHDAGEIFVVGASGVFGVELHVFDERFRILHGCHGSLDDFLAGWS